MLDKKERISYWVKKAHLHIHICSTHLKVELVYLPNGVTYNIELESTCEVELLKYSGPRLLADYLEPLLAIELSFTSYSLCNKAVPLLLLFFMPFTGEDDNKLSLFVVL